jgi:hypothetical protein
MFVLKKQCLFVGAVLLSAGVVLSADNPVAAAVVPDADLLIRLDVAKMMQSPIIKALEAKSKEAASGEEDEMEKLMATHLGLTTKDFVAFVGSATTASLYALEDGATPDWTTLPVAATVTIAKPITMAKVKAFLDASKEESGEGDYEMVQVAGRAALKMFGGEDGQPPLFMALSDSGQAAYMALSQAGLHGAIQRATGATPVGLSAPLVQLRKTLPTGTQLAYLYQAPDALRELIKKASADAAAAGAAEMDPMAGMMIGLVKMFENLQSVGLGMAVTDSFKLHLGADLGGAPQAQQASMMLKNMLLPMLQMQLAGMAAPGEDPIDANSLISVKQAASILMLDLSIDQPMIDNLQGMIMGAMMGGMMGGGMEMEMSADEELVF